MYSLNGCIHFVNKFKCHNGDIIGIPDTVKLEIAIQLYRIAISVHTVINKFLQMLNFFQ